MAKLAHTARMAEHNLQNQWQRHDWQRSPFAPNLRIVQALVQGKTASGAGFSRYDALTRCHGETAEILAMRDGESSEGLAAGPDMEFAAERALSERLERWALWKWWHGSLSAQPVLADQHIEHLRLKAAIPRETALWHLPEFPHIHVVIAQSRALDGTQPILGFGANVCPAQAAQKALIELGMMELNLLTPTAGLQDYFERLERNVERLPEGTASALPMARAGPVQSITFEIENRTPKGCALSVAKAILPDAPSWMGVQGPML